MLTQERAINFIDLPLFYFSLLFMCFAVFIMAVDFNHIFTVSIWLPMGIALFSLSFYNGAYGLYAMTFLVSFFAFKLDQSQNLLMLNIFFLFGAYGSSLSGGKSLRLKFLASIKNRDTLIVFVVLWMIVLLLSTLGMPFFSLVGYYLGDGGLDVGRLRLILFDIVCLLTAVYFLGVAGSMKKVKLVKNILFSLLVGVFFAVVTELVFVWNGQFSIKHLIFLVPLFPAVLLFAQKNSSTTSQSALLLASVFLLVIMAEIALVYYGENIGLWAVFPISVFLVWMYIFYMIVKQKEVPAVAIFMKKGPVRLWSVILIASVFLFFLILSVQNFSESAISHDRSWMDLFRAFFAYPVFGSGDYGLFDEDGYQVANMYHELVLGKGAFGAAIFVGMIWVVLYRLTVKEFSLQANRLESFEQTLLGVSIAGSLAVMGIVGFADKLFFVYPFQLLFWLLLFCGIVLTRKIYTNREDVRHFRSSFRFLFGFLLFLLPLHLLTVPYFKNLIDEVSGYLGFLGVFSDSYIYPIVLSSLGIAFMAMFVNLFIINYSYRDRVFMDDTVESKSHAMHKVPTPRVGGIGIFMANVFLVFFPLGLQFILVSLFAFIAGILDDIKSISPKLRLLLQAVAAILFMAVFGYMIDRIGFGIVLPLWFALPFTVFAMVGVTNAFNIIDGLNGLAGGIAFLVLLSFGYVALSVHDLDIFKVIVVNIMAIFGFLLINYPRGKIFMGDGGAYFVGFSLVAMAIMLFSRHADISPLYTVATVIYPVFEVIYSIYRRKVLRSGDSTKADRLHLHSLLHKRVFRSNPKTSLFIWLGYFPFLFLASLFYDNDFVCAGLIVLFCAMYVMVYRKVLLKVR